MSIYTKAFWKDAGERSFWTFIQVFGATLGTYVAAGNGLFDMPWGHIVSIVGAATLFAVLKAMAANRVNPETGASTGTSVPRGSVAAVENVKVEGDYTAEEAAPYPEGTPVDVIPDLDRH